MNDALFAEEIGKSGGEKYAYHRSLLIARSQMPRFIYVSLAGAASGLVSTTFKGAPCEFISGFLAIVVVVLKSKIMNMIGL